MSAMLPKDLKYNDVGGGGGDENLGSLSLKYFRLLVRELSKIIFPSGTMKEKQCV